MSLTLLMTWDIRPSKEREYFEFVVRDWAPATMQMGLQIVAAWYTAYRRSPRRTPIIRVEALAPDEETLRDILTSPEWEELHEQLSEYIDNYKQKVLETTGEFLL